LSTGVLAEGDGSGPAVGAGLRDGDGDAVAVSDGVAAAGAVTPTELEADTTATRRAHWRPVSLGRFGFGLSGTCLLMWLFMCILLDEIAHPLS
jgi:hypothetical protein